MNKDTILQRRDAKVKHHVEQYAPVWLVNEDVSVEENAVMFNIIFQHRLYGWVSRRYRYDAFNDVLYHKGQNLVTEEDVLEIQEQEPYVDAVIADIPNSYGG